MSLPATRAVPPHSLRSKPGLTPAGRSNSQRLAPKSSQVPASSSSSSSALGPADGASPQATAALIRRVLCPSSNSAGLSSPRPWQEQLPPLTSDGEVDEQLYAIIAVVLKEFVHAWYGKITPDHYFTDEVIRIVSTCTGRIEARARRVDWVEVLGDQAPFLIDRHVKSYVASHGSSQDSSFVSTRRAYHALNLHPALEPSNQCDADPPETPTEDELAYRQLLVQSILPLLLPHEDLKNPTLRILVADVVAGPVLGNVVSGRLGQGWMIWESIGKVVTIAKARRRQQQYGNSRTDPVEGPPKAKGLSPAENRSMLERSGLLEIVSEGTSSHERSHSENRQTILPSSMLRLLALGNYVYLTIGFVVSFARSVYAAASLPDRTTTVAATQSAIDAGGQASLGLSSDTVDHASGPSNADDQNLTTLQPAVATGVASDVPISVAAEAPESANGSSNQDTHRDIAVTRTMKRPILRYAAFDLVNRIMRLSDRMPLLGGALEMLRYHLTGGLSSVGHTNGALDKYLYRQIYDHLSPSMIAPALLAFRIAVFPNNTLAPPRKIPSSEEQDAIRHQTAEIILSCIPDRLSRHYFGDEKEGKGGPVIEVENILDTFSDSYCNRHLLFRIVDLLVMRLFPEIEQSTVAQLLDEGIER